jgi:Flp pilus assembly pilin Flp
MWHTAKQGWREEKGLTTLEYALLLALILVVAAGAWRNLSQI